MPAPKIVAIMQDFIFDQEIVAQAVWSGARLEKISVPHRYFAEVSTIGFVRSVRYGLGVLSVLVKFLLNREGVLNSRLFQQLHQAYTEVLPDSSAPSPPART